MQSSTTSDFHFAAERGEIEVMREMISAPYRLDPAVKTADGYNALHLAAINGQIKAMHFLMSEPCNLNPRDKSTDGYNALHLAAMNGQIKAMHFLMSEPCNLNPRDKSADGYNALHLATFNNQVGAMLKLICAPYGLEPTEKSAFGPNAFEIAALFGQIKALDFLLCTFLESFEVEAAFHLAAINGQVEMMQYLMGEPYRQDPSVKTQQGLNGLHLAAKNGQVEVMKLLMNEPYRQDPSVKTLQGLNALHLAAKNGQVEVMKLLMNEPYKLDPAEKIEDEDEEVNSFQLAVLSGSVEAMKLFMDEPYSFRPAEGSINELSIAAMHGQVEVMKLLMSEPYNLDPSLKTGENRENALHLAAINGHIEAIKLLMNAPCSLDPAETNANGDNVLHLAVMCLQVDAVDFILSNYPVQAGKCWTKNKRGLTPGSMDTGMSPSPLSLLRNYLIKHTDLIAQGEALNSKGYDLLEAFLEEWVAVLLDPDVDVNIKSVSDHFESMPAYEKIKEALSSLQAAAALKALDILDQPLSYDRFKHLLDLTRLALGDERNSSSSFFLSPDPKLFQSIKTCFLNISPGGTGELSANVIRTINVIIRDYERAAIDDGSKLIDAILISKLLSTNSIKLLRPNKGLSIDRNITQDNYSEHLYAINKAFLSLPVSEEVRYISREIILPGIKHLVTYIDEIVEHSIKTPSSIYYLVPGHEIRLAEPTELVLLPEVLYLYSCGDDLLFSLKTSEGDKRDLVFDGSETLVAEIKALINNNEATINDDDLKRSIYDKMNEIGHVIKLDELPLHTDHAAEGESDPEKLRETLHRLIQNILGAFYLCEDSGQLIEFFNKLSSGYCLEARISSTLEWATNLSEVKSIDSIMESAIADYRAYSMVINNANEESLYVTEPALGFIMQRYNNFPCKKNNEYAPEGLILEDGVKLYLENVLSFSVDCLSL